MVLVIDDDDGVREAILDVLLGENVEVRGVSTAGEAFDYLASHPPPRLILLDLVLPDMTGAEIRNRLLDTPRLASVPVVLMSASSNLDAQSSCRELAGRLRKPFDLNALLAVVGKFVTSR